MEDNLSLFQCVVKKSNSVIDKVFYYGGWSLIVVSIILLILVLGYLILLPIYTLMLQHKEVIIIPGLILGFILAIPVYSLIWCVTRKFSHEDWNDFEYAGLGVGISFLIVVMAVVMGIFSIRYNSNPLEILLLVVCSAFTLPIGYILGAYLHYRERIK